MKSKNFLPIYRIRNYLIAPMSGVQNFFLVLKIKNLKFCPKNVKRMKNKKKLIPKKWNYAFLTRLQGGWNEFFKIIDLNKLG